MSKQICLLVCLLNFASMAFFIPYSEAKVFRNAYLAFELPDHWICNLEKTEWVCRSGDARESREALIILTAKEAGPSDSFQIYESHLSNPIKTKSKYSAVDTSKMIYKSKNTQINQHTWVDGLHLGSEINNYYTRYLATIKDSVSILVTFSAHKDHYTKYSQDFLKAVMSLRVIANKNSLADAGRNGIRPPGTETIGIPDGAIPLDIIQHAGEEPTRARKNSTKYLGLAFLLMAVGIFFYMRAKKKS